MKNGIYKSDIATYFIYNNKILMSLKGVMYKTNKNFIQGQYKEDLSKDMISQFDKVYNEVKSW
jgi:hypothetical protein|tara:strand:- start:520 stop:708 length:189 start_codon:yes stop_codon:yes gene_type:complete